MHSAFRIGLSFVGYTSALAIILAGCGSDGSSAGPDSGAPGLDGGQAGNGPMDGGGDPMDATMSDDAAIDAGGRRDAATDPQDAATDPQDAATDPEEDAAMADSGHMEDSGADAGEDAGADAGEVTESICDDGIDNDGDESEDCSDSDCAHLATCGGVEAVCDDTIDDDLDGDIDCDDDDCGCRDCFADGTCTTASGLTPNVVIVLDYSTSLNSIWSDTTTRWQALVEALISKIEDPTSFLGRSHLALIRFAHDPQPTTPGTTVAGETTGITDGQSVDVVFDDEEGDYVCTMNVRNTLLATPAPMMGSLIGLGTWTKGAMDRAAALIQQTKAAHPGEDRPYAILVVTDGSWTSANGTLTLDPAGEDPALTAADLLGNQQIPTYAVVFAGDALAQMAGDNLAQAGGTTAAYDDIAEADAAMLGLCMP